MDNKNENPAEGFNARELSVNDINEVSGGSMLESINVDYNMYRAGISVKNCAFSKDTYWIGDTPISKETAEALRKASEDLWIKKYSESCDLVGFIKEWKGILRERTGIEWDGKIGMMHHGL